MAPRANWKGSAPFACYLSGALYPATSDSEKISFNQINRKAGHRIKYANDEFVPKSDIDPRYLIRPYYQVPDGKVGHDAFAVIRETIRNMEAASF
jgi:DNA end-binding protein Ku